MAKYVLYFKSPEVREFFDSGEYVKLMPKFHPFEAADNDAADAYVIAALPKWQVRFDGVLHHPKLQELRVEQLVKKY